MCRDPALAGAAAGHANAPFGAVSPSPLPLTSHLQFVIDKVELNTPIEDALLEMPAPPAKPPEAKLAEEKASLPAAVAMNLKPQRRKREA